MNADPMEAMIYSALTEAGIRFRTNWPPHPTGGNGQNSPQIDFYLPDHDLYIEVKQFHSDRIARQMAIAPNVIAVQGKIAVEWICTLLRKGQQ